MLTALLLKLNDQKAAALWSYISPFFPRYELYKKCPAPSINLMILNACYPPERAKKIHKTVENPPAAAVL